MLRGGRDMSITCDGSRTARKNGVSGRARRTPALCEGTLHVNTDTAEGVLQVTACDDKGQPIKGFEQSREIHSDKTAVAVS